MLVPILQTKLNVPGEPTRAGRLNLVSRLRLLDKLDACFARKLTLLCAPAGFGKSTLLAAWIRHRGEGHRSEGHRSERSPAASLQSNLPTAFAWFSIDDSDNDLVRFWSTFVAALQTVNAAVGTTTLAMLESPQPLPPDMLLTSLLNDLATHSKRILMVLDDYHVIHTPAIHKALLFFLEHLPPQLHIVLSSRSDPPWPLARWRSQDQLGELRIDDLRFTRDEATLFLQEVMELDLSTASISALESRTEGWIAGLQLAALSLQGIADREKFIAQFRGSNRYIVDYLIEEVLSHQPEKVQTFLLQTSILERLCAPLCDAVVYEGNALLESQAILESLEHANLFLISLDTERQWYRYHQLFAEVLQTRLLQSQRTQVPHLHQRASAWYEQVELWPEAIHHALAVADFGRAARLIEYVGLAHFAQSTIQQSLTRWLSTLPPEIVRPRPRLSLIYAWILFAHLDMASARQRVDDAEAAWQRTPDRFAAAPIGGEIAAMRSVLLAYTTNHSPADAIEWGQQALDTLNADQPTFRCIAGLAVGMAMLKLGDIQGAEQALSEASKMARSAENAYLLSVATSHEVAMQCAHGALTRALAIVQASLAWAAQQGALVYPTFGGLYLNYADLHREKNELEVAQRYAEEAVMHSDQEVNPSLFIMTRLVLLRIKQAQGDWERVSSLLGQVSTLAQQHPGIIHDNLLQALTAQTQMREAMSFDRHASIPAAALAWAQASQWEEGELLAAHRFYDYIFMYEHRRIARPQILLAWARKKGDRALLDEVFAYLQRQLRVAEQTGLLWYQIKLTLLQSLTLLALGDEEDAFAALQRALRLALAEGYIRVFLDEGESVWTMLGHFRSRLLQQPQNDQNAPLSIYVDLLLSHFGRQQSGERKAIPTEPAKSMVLVESLPLLLEPLSEREVDVLHLVASGFTNAEIALRLHVATSTVKTHLNHIFSKLGVQSRTQAIAHARELGLISA
jgi:LuxR family maltose regulon positive regulatory protein